MRKNTIMKNHHRRIRWTTSRFSVQTNNSRSISNVRIYSYATYDRSTGIKVHIKLYVPAWESPQPEFTAMSGIVSTTMHNRTEQKGYYATALGEKTISTDVSTGVYGASGEKGTINVSGVATSNNAWATVWIFYILCNHYSIIHTN